MAAAKLPLQGRRPRPLRCLGVASLAWVLCASSAFGQTDSEAATPQPSADSSDAADQDLAPRRLNDSAVFGSEEEWSLNVSAPVPRLTPLEQALQSARDAEAAEQLAFPTDRSAQFHYLSALDIDAENTAAQSGLTAIATNLLGQAETAVANSDFERARTLADAIARYPGDVVLDDLLQAIEEAERHASVRQSLLDALSRPLDADEMASGRRTEVMAAGGPDWLSSMLKTRCPRKR